ncbi:MAG: hypothetical protein LBI28_04680 [Treponema sp.]|jgi:hypothetical protein|nr:hypothetical protein [Treponema sp.]
MKNKVFTLALLMLMIASAGLWAQNLPGGIWTSPQSSATEGRYRSNADDFIRPDAYTGLRLNNWFGMVAFNNLGSTDLSMATLGFATKVNDVYIGTFYSGNFWTWAPTNYYTETSTTPTGGPAGIYDVYSSINVVPNPINNVALLIGVADMGFRLTYRTNYQSFTNSNIVVGSQLYRNYHAEEGYLAPQIAWAMAKDLVTGKGIRPYVTLDLVFDRNYQKTETAGSDGTATGEKILRSQNHFDPSLGIGLGGYTFYNKDGFRGSFDLDYVFTMKLYDNEYSYVEGGQYKTGRFNGIFSPGSFPYTEQSNMFHSLTPSISGSWSKDRLALKFKLNMVLTLTTDESNTMALNGSSLVRNGNSDLTTTFTFRPDLRLSLQYKLIPDRLTLNTGARIQATSITLTTIDHKYYNDGAETRGQATTIHQNSFGDNSGGGSGFASRFNIGVTYNFTENAWVEALTGVSGSYGNKSAIEVFGTGDNGLFSFGSILVVLKF